MPRVNIVLMVGVLVLVVAFESSSTRLASAYGIAVTGDMVITSILAITLFYVGPGNGRLALVAGGDAADPWRSRSCSLIANADGADRWRLCARG